MASLTVATGEQVGAHFPLATRPLTAGRDPSRDIQIIDPKVSRKHFQIRKVDDHYIVVEFKSVNGVLVNGDKISGEHALEDGDQIKVGDTTLIFSEADNADATDALQKYKIVSRESREDRTLMD